MKMQLPVRQLFVVLAFAVILATIALYAYSSPAGSGIKTLLVADGDSNDERTPPPLMNSINTTILATKRKRKYFRPKIYAKQDTRIPAVSLPVNNPGCNSRIIRDYKPRVPGPEYYHPSIIHYVKLYRRDGVKGSLLFREFLAIMSAYKFYSPRMIILHSNADFTSDVYWNDALLWENVFMKFDPIKKPRRIAHQPVSNLYHAANYLKLKILLIYGGIMSDLDVIILNGLQLRKQQRQSECLLSCEMNDVTYEKCVKVNSGFYSCVKNSSFLREWLQIYSLDFRPKQLMYNSGDVPSRILRTKVPSCYNVWTDEEILMPSTGYANRWMLGIVDWRSKPAAHYVARLLNLPIEDELLLTMRTSLGNMLRHVYDAKLPS